LGRLEKSHKSQDGKVRGQVFRAVSMVVLQMVTLFFERMERFVFDFPAGFCHGNHLAGILLIKIERLSRSGFDLEVFDIVDHQLGILSSERESNGTPTWLEVWHEISARAPCALRRCR